MKLFVDDIRQAPEGWQGARTITEAIRKLSSGLFTTLSMDFDIACSHNGCYRGEFESFEAVARYVAEMRDPPMSIYLHTGNPLGAELMSRLLSGAKNSSYYRVTTLMYNENDYNPLDAG